METLAGGTVGVDPEKNDRVWQRLLSGEELEGLGLPLKDGRLDLSGLVSPEPVVSDVVPTSMGNLVFGKSWEVNGGQWKSLDFSGSRLGAGRFTNCTIINCVFDRCFCQDWRLWATTVQDTSFCAADLRESLLGGIDGGKRNTFRNVDFSRADLRGTMYFPAEFFECVFKNSRLKNINFDSSCFTDCTFEGELREVIFNRVSPSDDGPFPPNDMRGVDFSKARLRWVEFRGIELDDVRLPADPDHIIIERDFRGMIDWILEATSREEDDVAKVINVLARHHRSRGAPNQKRGLLVHMKDLADFVGPEGPRRLLEIINSKPSSSEQS
jgi:uncharacterized protein YjbI with pentapeptide repeats